MTRIHNIAASIAVVALILALTAQGQGPLHHSEYIASSAQTVDTLNLRAKGLLHDSVYTVFLTGLGDERSGAAEYIGELETNEEGRGALRVDAVVDVRKNLNHAVLHLFNPVAEDICFTPGSTAGRTASLATIFISNSRPIDDNASLFHTINWRFTKCDSTF